MDMIWWIVILVVLLAVSIGGWWLSQRSSPSSPADAGTFTGPIQVIRGPGRTPAATDVDSAAGDAASDAAAIIGGSGRLSGDGVGTFTRGDQQVPVPIGARLGAAGSDQAPTGYPIKGDAEAEIYYTPGGPGYDDAQAQVWFASEGAARAAGFHPAQTP